MRKAIFDRAKMESYANEARQRWGSTSAYQESEAKTRGKSEEELQGFGRDMMQIFAEFTPLIGKSPASMEAQNVVQKLQQFITDHFYTCTKPILCGLGQMYTADERFRANIDAHSAEGTAAFAAEAIAIYCQE